jgi:hypothetical protein
MSFETCKATCENRTKRFLNTYGHDKDGWPMTTHTNVEPNAMRFPIPGTQDELTVTVTGSGSSQDAALRERLGNEGVFVDPAKPVPPVDRSQETQEWWTGHVSTPKPKPRGEEIAGKRIKAGNGTGIIFYTPDGEPDVSVVPVSESTQIGTLADLREWLATAIDQAIAEERRACAGLADEFINFTGATYCDLQNRKSTDLAPHDYGRGGCDARRGIAAAIRARGSK